ncbi:MAG: hypothetical protein EB117_17065, partial [Betaproteobacteria bacterium]|nr:hypothetical protein [Betaproteobacteria bacterium]
TGGLTLSPFVPGETTFQRTSSQTIEAEQPKTIATQAEANQQNFQYALADYYIQPNGTIYVVDRTTGELSQYQPGQGPVSAVAGGALQKAGSLMGREEQLPADAKYSGSLKTFDPATYAQGLSSTNFGTMALVGELDKDAPSFNLRITKNPDGTTTQTNSTTGDVVTFSATGQPIPERSSESLRTQLSAYVGGVAGGVQEAVGEYGKSILSAASAIGLPVERALQVARNLESGGQLMQSAQYRQQESDYLQGNRDAFTAYTQTGDKSKLYSDITENFKNNPMAAFGLLGKEGIQELGEAALFGPATLVQRIIGESLAGTIESFGAQYEDTKRQLMAKNMPEKEARAEAAKAGGIDGFITFVVEALTPGSSRTLTAIPKEMAGEFIETLTQQVAQGKSLGSALGDAWSAALTAGKLTAGAETAVRAMQNVADTGGISFPTTQAPTNLGTLTVTAKAQPTGVVVNVSGDSALIQFSDGKTSILPSIDLSTGQKVNVGQSVNVNQQGQIASTAAVTPTAELGGNTAVVVAVNPKNNTASVMTPTGETKIVSSIDLSTSKPVSEGQSVILNSNNTISTAPVMGTAGLGTTGIAPATTPGYTGTVQPTVSTTPTVTAGVSPTVKT